MEEHKVFDLCLVCSADGPSEVAVSPPDLPRVVFLNRVLRVMDEQVGPLEELLDLFVLLPCSELPLLHCGRVVAGILRTDVEKVAVRFVIICRAEDLPLILEPVAEHEDGV